MSLMLHAGAQPVDYDALRQLAVPAATETHVPVPHHAVVEMVKYSLGFFGHEIVGEDYGVTPDGARFFGVLSLRSEYGDYADTVGLRNSHDKRFPIGISFGSRVFVCDNLAFSGDHVIKRKHTANAKRDLPGLVAEVVEPLRDQRVRQARMFDQYRRTTLLEHQVDQIVMQLYRRGVINVQRIADVIDAYEDPPHDWGPDPSAWRLFNATTFALAGRVSEDPSVTSRLHGVIDGYCEVVPAAAGVPTAAE
jgi:hypothetical protein